MVTAHLLSTLVIVKVKAQCVIIKTNLDQDQVENRLDNTKVLLC